MGAPASRADRCSRSFSASQCRRRAGSGRRHPHPALWTSASGRGPRLVAGAGQRCPPPRAPRGGDRCLRPHRRRGGGDRPRGAALSDGSRPRIRAVRTPAQPQGGVDRPPRGRSAAVQRQRARRGPPPRRLAHRGAVGPAAGHRALAGDPPSSGRHPRPTRGCGAGPGQGRQPVAGQLDRGAAGRRRRARAGRHPRTGASCWHAARSRTHWRPNSSHCAAPDNRRRCARPRGPDA